MSGIVLSMSVAGASVGERVWHYAVDVGCRCVCGRVCGIMLSMSVAGVSVGECVSDIMLPMCVAGTSGGGDVPGVHAGLAEGVAEGTAVCHEIRRLRRTRARAHLRSPRLSGPR